MSLRPPNVLRMSIRSASDIIAMSDALSDAIAKVSVGNSSELSTSVAKETTSPIWNAVFMFPASDRTATFKITVEHERWFGNKFLGCVKGAVADYRGVDTEKVTCACVGCAPVLTHV